MKCNQPECSEEGIIRLEGNEWMCPRHANERVNSPKNTAMAQADEDLQAFRAAGGKVS
jgi:hypothetical protein